MATESPPAPRNRALDLAAAGFVLVLLAIGALALWTAVPLGTAWAISKLTETPSTHFIAGLLAIPTAMALFAPVLFWLNNLYLRIRAAADPQAEDGWPDEGDLADDEPEIVPRGPIEPLLLGSFALAIVAMVVWFFVFAENPVLTT